jgi:hypothetical protein
LVTVQEQRPASLIDELDERRHDVWHAWKIPQPIEKFPVAPQWIARIPNVSRGTVFALTSVPTPVVTVASR